MVYDDDGDGDDDNDVIDRQVSRYNGYIELDVYLLRYSENNIDYVY